MRTTLLAAAALVMSACGQTGAQDASSAQAPSFDDPAGTEVAIFASGCFWCTEADFEKLDGVVDVVSGYTGGDVANPGYREVVRGGTGHVEATRIVFDPEEIGYDQLLYHYWRNVDPIDGTGQFCDRGESYAPYIFFTSPEQAQAALESRQDVADRFDEPIKVRVEASETFWQAEDYHQDYAEKNPQRYQQYRSACRRDQRLRQLWGSEAGGLG